MTTGSLADSKTLNWVLKMLHGYKKPHLLEIEWHAELLLLKRLILNEGKLLIKIVVQGD